jgi:hypothetical protein
MAATAGCRAPTRNLSVTGTGCQPPLAVICS